MRSARTSAGTKNEMISKCFKASLRLITVILIAFLAAVSNRKHKLNMAVKSVIDDPGFIVAMAKAMTKKKPRWMPEVVWKVVFNLVIDFPVRQVQER